MCASKTFESWSEAYLGGKKSDNYPEPRHAGTDWWKGLQVRKVMVTAGGEEVLARRFSHGFGKESKGRGMSTVIRIEAEAC